MPPHERTTPVIDLVADIENLWHRWRRSLKEGAFTHSDGLRFLTELRLLALGSSQEALLRLGAARNVTGSAEPAGDAASADGAESTAVPTNSRLGAAQEPHHAALSLARCLPDDVVESIRDEWGNTNVAVIKHWRDAVLNGPTGGAPKDAGAKSDESTGAQPVGAGPQPQEPEE